MHVRAPSVRVCVRLRVHSRRRRVSARACTVLCVRALACTYVHGDVRLAPCLCRHFMGRAHCARRRSDAPFDDDGCSPECVSPTHHDAYIPRRRIPSRLQASATNPEDYVTDHQIWLGLLLVCDGRHRLFPARAALIGRSVWVNRYCITSSVFAASPSQSGIADVPVSQNSIPSSVIMQ